MADNLLMNEQAIASSRKYVPGLEYHVILIIINAESTSQWDVDVTNETLMGHRLKTPNLPTINMLIF